MAISPPLQERQHLQQCLLHALNNLFQERAFFASDLNKIADGLAPGTLPLPLLHPFRTAVVGNYNVTVAEVALNQKGRQLKWHDARDRLFESLDLPACFGLLVNVQSGGAFGFLGGRHWVALRCFDGAWMNLDSKLKKPELVVGEASSEAGSPAALLHFIGQLASTADAKVLFVT